MRANSLEDIIPGLREAREKERQNRALAFSDVPWTVCGLDVVVLTPRHRLEFQLVQNAYAVGGLPTRKDLFVFLWRLNPAFKKQVWFGLTAWFARRKVSRAVRTADLGEAREQVVAYLAAMIQDLPEGSGDRNTVNPPELYVHWLAGEINFYLKNYNGFSIALLMDTSYLVLQQLYRAHRLASESHPNFINESDRIIGRWQRENIRPQTN